MRRLAQGLETLAGAAWSGCTASRGHARFTRPHEVLVGASGCCGPNGSSSMSARVPRSPPPGPGPSAYLTNSSHARSEALPRASHHRRRQLYRAGVRADVPPLRQPRSPSSRRRPRLVDREDDDVSDAICGILTPRASTFGLTPSASALRSTARRRPGLDCEAGAPAVDRLASAARHRAASQHRRSGARRGRHRVRRRGISRSTTSLRTNVPGIWALGDCNGRGGFTHTAYNDFEIVASNLLDGVPEGRRPHPGLWALHRSAARPGRLTERRRRRAGGRSVSASGR